MWRVLVVGVFGFGCTKANPAASCVDGICSDPEFPYCDVDGAISGDPGACIAVTCMPGSVGACEGSSAALICNTEGNGYEQMPCAIGCDAGNHVCTNLCTSHAQCASGICKSDGSCATESEIAFVSVSGSPTSDCSRQVPCTLPHALTLPTPSGGLYIELATGQYDNDTSLTVTGKRFLVGAGASSTVLRHTTYGPILIVNGDSDLTVDSITLRDATSDPVQSNQVYGIGISCPSSPPGTRSLHVFDSIFSNNGTSPGGGAIITGNPCTVEIRRSIFDGNYAGAIIYGSAVVDRCTFNLGLTDGLTVYGNYSITNSFMVRNQTGANVVGATSMPIFAFNTVVDNSNFGILCAYGAQQPAVDLQNNIIARNATNIVDDSPSPNCSHTGSIVATDATALMFKHPDTAPYDYHITTGSTAIDTAVAPGTANDHDYDGDTRPKGGGPDVGADEAP